MIVQTEVELDAAYKRSDFKIQQIRTVDIQLQTTAFLELFHGRKLAGPNYETQTTLLIW
jgi:hypothetical protein